MAYVVPDMAPMRAATTVPLPQQIHYSPWYVQGYTAFGEPTRREDAPLIAPCRTTMLSPVVASGSYRVPGLGGSPVPRVSG